MREIGGPISKISHAYGGRLRGAYAPLFQYISPLLEGEGAGGEVRNGLRQNVTKVLNKYNSLTLSSSFVTLPQCCL
jgi:hypothetical protein